MKNKGVDGNSLLKHWRVISFFSKNRNIFLLHATIPTIGLMFSSFGFCTAFQRSGAVLIAVAILLAYYKNGIAKLAEEHTKFLDATSDLTNANTIARRIQQANKITPEKAKEGADIVLRERKKHQLSKEIANDLGDEIYKSEALMGASGTLIWGFGDFICWCKYPLNIMCIFV